MNASFFLEPGVSHVQSPSFDTDVGAYTDDSVMEADDADGTIATAVPGDRVDVEGILVDVYGF